VLDINDARCNYEEHGKVFTIKLLTVKSINNHVTLSFVLRTSVLEFALPRVLLD
jgi:hypothetical protein